MRPPARLGEPILVLAVFLADRASKAWAQQWLAPVFSLRILPFFHLTYVENTGAAWGMFQGRNVFLIALSVGLLAGLLVLRRRWPKNEKLLHYGAALVAGGALGNLYDRIALGHVIDFLDFIVWPVFNIADSAITAGACLLAFGMREKR